LYKNITKTPKPKKKNKLTTHKLIHQKQNTSSKPKHATTTKPKNFNPKSTNHKPKPQNQTLQIIRTFS